MKLFRPVLTVLLAASALPLCANDDPLKSFVPGKPGQGFVPSTPSPKAPAMGKKYPREYILAISEVFRAFRARDWKRTREALDKAEKIVPPNEVTLNTRGAIFIEERNFEEGARLCQEALRIEPRFYPARFNLAEIPLVKGDYAGARKMFEKFVRENPKDELARFRVFLTFLLEKKDDEARQEIELIPFPGDTPAFYFANAAWEFARGTEEEARKWLGRADWTFGPDKCALFADSLYELGWMKRGEAVGPRSPAAPAAAPAAPPEPQTN